MEQLPQQVQLAVMTLQSRVVELEKEALTNNGVIENLQKLISERSPLELGLKDYSGKESEFYDL